MLAAGAHAASGTGPSTLPWKTQGEVLQYRSCGCADACWVAEVRSVPGKALKARLRCDCERLHFSVGAKGAERVYAPSCEASEGPGKPQWISQTMQRLLAR